MDIPDEIKSKLKETPPEVIEYITLLHGIIGSMDARIKELESRLNLNSRNSGKPPSSDGYARKNRQNSQDANNLKKPGGQPGHKGKTLHQSPNPDHIQPHKPEFCHFCRKSLENANTIKIEKRQVFDLPPPPHIEITEHQAHTIRCNHCGKKSSGKFPQDVTKPVQYGSRIRAYVSYLTHYQLIPYERTAELCSDLFGFSISPGTIVNLTHNLSENLHHFEENVLNSLKCEPVIHNDETGLRVEGKLHWLHVTCTKLLTHYSLQSKRGTDGINAIGVLTNFNGVSVHDFWGSYLAYPCKHSFCCAHIIRELIRAEEESSQNWPSKLIDLLLEAKTLKEAHHYNGLVIPQNLVDNVKKRYGELIQTGLNENPPPIIRSAKRGRIKKTFTRNLLERLETWKCEVLRFIDDPLVPFDNNLAERDIRMVKVKMKISGGFRDYFTAEAVALIRSYISTVRKNDVNVIEAIIGAFEKNPWITKCKLLSNKLTEQTPLKVCT